MSMKIERDITGRKFQVKLQGIRTKEYVKDLDELTIAIAHYFGIHDKHDRSKCPFCKSSLF